MQVATTTHSQPALQGQLFRYAQDLEALMDQHSTLQLRYQTLLQSQGRASLSNDLLMSSFRDGNTPYIATDIRGVITLVSASVEPLLGESGLDLAGSSLTQLAPHSQRPYLGALLGGLAQTGGDSSIVQCQLQLFDGRDIDSVSCFDVLIVPLHNYGQVEYLWLLNAAKASGTTDCLTVLQQFQLFRDSSIGLLITDAHNRIYFVNCAYTHLTGYNAEEVFQKNPRLHASGRQSADFYQEFWSALSMAGNWSGEFFNRRKDGHIYPEWKTVRTVKNTEGKTLAYLSVFVDSSAQHHHTDVLTRMAYHDALTGLPNRRLLQDRLAHALSQAQRDDAGLSLLFIDLDRFKPINDKLGHVIGDLVLQEVGKRLRRSVRQGDTVARIGGDEFVILLHNSVRNNVQNIANIVRSKIGEPIDVAGHRVQVGVSIGCARYPQDATDSAALHKHADSAMYEAKRQGGNTLCFFDAHGQYDGPNELGSDLWQALARHELHLLYQPQVDALGRMKGCEALLRWTHSTYGEITPATFIPVAETNGAILPLGDWVLQTACQQLQQWNQAGLTELTMSVNVSTRQLADPNFCQRVKQALQSHALSPEVLEIEITESEALRNEQAGHELLRPLRELGVRIAIDDFGTGYSGLSRLQNLAVDRLKMDQSFVRDLATSANARALSQCFISVGQAMGLEVVAEGVETAEQLEILLAQGFHLVQGFLTGGPMPADVFFAWHQQNIPPVLC